MESEDELVAPDTPRDVRLGTGIITQAKSTDHLQALRAHIRGLLSVIGKEPEPKQQVELGIFCAFPYEYDMILAELGMADCGDVTIHDCKVASFPHVGLDLQVNLICLNNIVPEDAGIACSLLITSKRLTHCIVVGVCCAPTLHVGVTCYVTQIMYGEPARAGGMQPRAMHLSALAVETATKHARSARDSSQSLMNVRALSGASMCERAAFYMQLWRVHNVSVYQHLLCSVWRAVWAAQRVMMLPAIMSVCEHAICDIADTTPMRRVGARRAAAALMSYLQTWRTEFPTTGAASPGVAI